MTTGMTINPGVTINAGVSLGIPSITINSGDFNNGNNGGGTSSYVTPSGGNLYCPLYALYSPNGDIAARMVAFFTACGYNTSDSYVFYATFASATPATGGSFTPYPCLVRASWSGSELDMVVIDQTNTGWQGGNPGSGSQLEGTFTLPVTLTPYTPTTNTGPINWC